MFNKCLILLFLLKLLETVTPARILVVVPTPSVSHQIVFRPLIQELAKRGHEIVIITTDPDIANKQENIKQIDVHNISYDTWNEIVMKSETTNGTNDDLMKQVVNVFSTVVHCFEKQVLSNDVQELLKSKTKFDLLIIESFVRPALAFTHVYNAPVILMSTFGSIRNVMTIVGAPMYPKLLYPDCLHQRVYNLTLWEKIKTIYDVFWMNQYLKGLEVEEDKLVKKLFGEDTPPLSELEKNVDMLFLNINPIWELNRPVPPSVLYIGGIHQKPTKELPKELKSYLDSSKNGVIYVSFGTNVNPSQLPSEKIRILTKVFSELPYDILWKCDIDKLPNSPNNIKTAKWLPQSDLLKHPKIKLFITQGGLQSTDEALFSGVPLIGIPLLGDQWFNIENYVKHKIGEAVQMETLEEETLKKAILTVVNDDSYRANVRRLRSLMHDQPQRPLERAVWWTEHVLRHGGAAHLAAPAANITWAEYLDVELLLVLILTPLLVIIASIYVIVKIVSKIRRYVVGLRRDKRTRGHKRD